PPSAMTPALGGTAPTSPSSSSKLRRSIRARVGTGKNTSVAAMSLIITTRRGSNTDRSWAGRLPPGHRPCLCYEGGSRSFRTLRPWLHPLMTPIADSIDEYQAFLKTLGYSAEAAYGKKV